MSQEAKARANTSSAEQGQKCICLARPPRAANMKSMHLPCHAEGCLKFGHVGPVTVPGHVCFHETLPCAVAQHIPAHKTSYQNEWQLTTLLSQAHYLCYAAAACQLPNRDCGNSALLQHLPVQQRLQCTLVCQAWATACTATTADIDAEQLAEYKAKQLQSWLQCCGQQVVGLTVRQSGLQTPLQLPCSRLSNLERLFVEGCSFS